MGKLWFILLFVVFGNIPIVVAQDAPSVEGEWEMMSASPLTSVSQGDLGKRLSITRNGDAYEVKWLSGPRASNEATVYSGSSAQIVNVFNDPIWSGDWTPGEFRGDEAAPATLRQEVAGITYPCTVSYTLSGDGNSLQRSEDADRVHWENGHYKRYEILPGFFKSTFKRISGPVKVENRADRAYQADCGPIDPNNPNRTTPITTDLCPGNLVTMTYFCGGNTGCPYVCCPKGLPYLNHCDCKCYATTDFDCHSHSVATEQPRQ